MNIYETDLNQKISLALNSKDVNILKILKNDFSSVIRKLVAKNSYASKEILNELAFDPVLNVSYTALQNQNCTVQRVLNSQNHPCVKCNTDFAVISNCSNCIKLSSFKEKLYA